MVLVKKRRYIAPAIKEILLTSIDGVAEGTPGMNRSRLSGDDDDKVKGEVIWASEEEGDSFNPYRTDIWDTEW